MRMVTREYTKAFLSLGDEDKAYFASASNYIVLIDNWLGGNSTDIVYKSKRVFWLELS